MVCLASRVEIYSNISRIAKIYVAETHIEVISTDNTWMLCFNPLGYIVCNLITRHNALKCGFRYHLMSFYTNV